MATKADVRFTSGFKANVAAIKAWWRRRGAQRGMAMLDQEVEQSVDSLERHPRIGRDFMARAPQSSEASSRVAELQHRRGNVEIREYLAGDYLILYSFDPLAQPPTVQMLSIRHHREISFAFDDYWQENRESARSRK